MEESTHLDWGHHLDTMKSPFKKTRKRIYFFYIRVKISKIVKEGRELHRVALENWIFVQEKKIFVFSNLSSATRNFTERQILPFSGLNILQKTLVWENSRSPCIYEIIQLIYIDLYFRLYCYA